MLTELGDALLDLTVTEKGIGNALYAVESVPDPGCSQCSCTVLCCTCSWPW